MCSETVEPKTKKLIANLQGIKSHTQMMERLRKTLHYGYRGSLFNDDIEFLSMPLTEASVELITAMSNGNRGLQIFDMSFASNVSRKSFVSPCSLMMAMIYLKRLKQKNPDYLRTVSPCDLFLVSLMIASKFLFDDGEDEEVFNDDWAQSGGISVCELNRLEREFLEALEWSCYVDPKTFIEQLIKVEAAISMKQLQKRCTDGTTYNELLSLLDYSQMVSGDKLQSLIMESIVKVLIASSIVYSVTVLTLFASTTVISGALSVVRNAHSNIISNPLLYNCDNCNDSLPFSDQYSDMLPIESINIDTPFDITNPLIVSHKEMSKGTINVLCEYCHDNHFNVKIKIDNRGMNYNRLWYSSVR